MCILLLLTSCARTVRVPPSNYRDPGSAPEYVIRTLDGSKYRAAEFAYTDSSLVVTKIRDLHEDSSHSGTTLFEIPLSNVASVDKVLPNDTGVVTVVLLISAVVGFLWLVGSGLSVPE